MPNNIPSFSFSDLEQFEIKYENDKDKVLNSIKLF